MAVRNNVVHSNAGAGIYLDQAPGAVLDIYNNFIFDNLEDGIWLDNFGLPWDGTAAVRILNNSIDASQDYGIAAVWYDNAPVFIRNNAVYGSADPDIDASGADQDYNLTGDGSAIGPNSWPNQNPSFVSATNLHLQSGSIARGKAQDLTATFGNDIDDESASPGRRDLGHRGRPGGGRGRADAHRSRTTPRARHRTPSPPPRRSLPRSSASASPGSPR